MGERQAKLKKNLLKLARCSAVTGLVYAAVRFAWPFLLAYGLAALIEPAVEALSRKLHLKRGFASALCVLGILLALCLVLAAVIWRAVYELGQLLRSAPELAASFSQTVEQLRSTASRLFAKAPAEVTEFLSAQLDNLNGWASSLAADLAARLLRGLSRIAGRLPDVLFGAGTCVVACFFVSAGYGRISAFLRRQIPDRHRQKASHMRRAALGSVGKWLKAQLLLMAVTFVILALAFCLLRVEYAVLLALLIGLLDALPVIGSGMVLLPWAGISLLRGHITLGVGLLVTYVVALAVRNALEPKLVSGRQGPDPAATLLAIYLGSRLMGVAGMILFPIAAMILFRLCQTGVLKLWK